MTRKGDKYSTYPLWRQIINRYAGFITVGTLALIVFIGWELFYEEPYFFEQWGCQKIYNYMLNDEGYGYTPHNDLPEEQHLRLHEILEADCKQYQHGT